MAGWNPAETAHCAVVGFRPHEEGVTVTKRIHNGRYFHLGRYTILRTEFGWHIFAGDTTADRFWVNGAYDTLREAKEVIARIEANPEWRAETDALLVKQAA